MSSLSPTYRALFLGTLGCLLVGAGSQYTDMMLKRSGFTGWYYTPGALIILFLVILIANPLAGLMRRRWMLTSAELAQMYVMWIVGSAVSTCGIVSYLLPMLTSVVYYASPENNWSYELLPLIPDWVIPSKEFGEIKDFYEGGADGVPWRMWLPPLLHWLPFALSLHIAMIAIMVILRRQWVQHERLIFPMTQLPIAMIQDGKSPELIKPLFKSWLFWLGFAIPFFIQSYNGVNRHFPFLPQIAIGGYYLYFLEDQLRLRIGINFMMIGFTYLVRREVSLGFWVFAIINFAQEAVMIALGAERHEPLFSHFSRGGTIASHQGFGAFLVLALFSLWNGRGHIAQVVRQAFGRDQRIDDSDEILSYRAAVLLLLGCVSFMGFWLWQAGLPAWITVIFLFLAFILFLGITRIISEGGLPYLLAPMVASDVVVGGIGTRALEATGIATLSLTYMWASDIITFVMVSCANGLKVVEEHVKRGRRFIFPSLVVALIVTMCSSAWVLLTIAYEHGGHNTSHYFAGQSQYPFEDALVRLRTTVGPQWEYWGYMATGGGIMGGLILLRQQFVWWPLHPIGFPISLVIHKMFFTVLVAWLLKTAILRYGGPKLFSRLRPFFLGLILGDFFPLAFLLLLDQLAARL